MPGSCICLAENLEAGNTFSDNYLRGEILLAENPVTLVLGCDVRSVALFNGISFLGYDQTAAVIDRWRWLVL